MSDKSDKHKAMANLFYVMGRFCNKQHELLKDNPCVCIKDFEQGFEFELDNGEKHRLILKLEHDV